MKNTFYSFKKKKCENMYNFTFGKVKQNCVGEVRFFWGNVAICWGYEAACWRDAPYTKCTPPLSTYYIQTDKVLLGLTGCWGQKIQTNGVYNQECIKTNVTLTRAGGLDVICGQPL